MFVICEEDRVADIRKKISVIKTIIQKCQQLMVTPVELANPLAATVFLTNESREVIEEAIKYPKAIELSRLLAISQNLKSKTEKSRILSCHIHEILYENYVNKRNLLKLQEINYEVEKLDLVENLLNVLKTKGFIWKKLSGNKCVLIEDPKVQAKRMKYLLDMKRFREDNRTLVYVEEKAIPADIATLNEYCNGNQSPESGTYRYVKIAVSPQLGVLSLSDINTSQTFTDWLTSEVTLHLKESYVVVLDEKAINEDLINQLPNPEAKKEDMVNWLERNNIPCCTSMHRAQLYELIDIYKDKLSGEKTFTDKFFKRIGVELVKIPDGWPMLNFFAPIWDLKIMWNPVEEEDVVTTLGKRVEMLVTSWSLEKVQQMNNDLEVIETTLYEKDMELEEVIDKLFTMAKDVAIPEVDLSNYSEVEGNDIEKYLKLFSGSLDPTVSQKFFGEGVSSSEINK